MCNQSAPQSTMRLASSASRAKSADSIDGAITLRKVEVAIPRMQPPKRDAREQAAVALRNAIIQTGSHRALRGVAANEKAVPRTTLVIRGR